MILDGGGINTSPVFFVLEPGVVMKTIKNHLKQFGLIAAALGVVFGHTASDFIKSVVVDAIMPIIRLVLNIDDWQNHSIAFGAYSIIWGDIVKNGIRFLIVAVGIIFILRWLEEVD